jgi:hypothetical protein
VGKVSGMLMRFDAEEGHWEVGHYRPNGHWEILVSSQDYEEQVALLNCLNGGTGVAPKPGAT